MARRAYLHGTQVGIDVGGVGLAELRVPVLLAVLGDGDRRRRPGPGLCLLGWLSGALDLLLGCGLDVIVVEVVAQAERGVGDIGDLAERDALALGGDSDGGDGGGTLGGGAGKALRADAGGVLLVSHG